MHGKLSTARGSVLPERRQNGRMHNLSVRHGLGMRRTTDQLCGMWNIDHYSGRLVSPWYGMLCSCMLQLLYGQILRHPKFG